ncbi:protein FAM192A [Artemisia annua]|uniref:Protein FAM192A n=1 Tax=Artemisia annua TaxID=35608 RepID=A0A2U1QEN0_ARTAN|nr:protein FAM192A [Artemisia annua]
MSILGYGKYGGILKEKGVNWILEILYFFCSVPSSRDEKTAITTTTTGSTEMADDGIPRLMNFVSESQLEENKKTRGPTLEDGTAGRDRPLFEILKDNKDKKDAEFNERFKHRPPKALDEDETEFLDTLELSRRQHEQQVADDEAQQLRSFQKQVAAQSATLYELQEIPTVVPKVQEPQFSAKKKTHPRPLGVVIKVKPQAKKAKTEEQAKTNSEECEGDLKKNDSADISTTDAQRPSGLNEGANEGVFTGGLVSYSDESDED